MNKKDSPVERWPGYIVLPAYLTFPLLSRWQKSIESAKQFEDSKDYLAFYEAILPTALDMVKEWHIEGLPEKVTLEDFPASTDLTSFVIDSVAGLYAETNSVDPKSLEKS